MKRKTCVWINKISALKRANGRHEPSGTSKVGKENEDDHLGLKNKGAADAIDDYYALCFSCNAAKRDLDDEYFRKFKAKYEIQEDRGIAQF